MVLTIKIMTREEKCKLFESKGFRYDPETGEITSHRGIVPKPNSRGYIWLGIRLDGKKIQLYGHQFAWWCYYREIQENDELVIDHYDRDPSNNRITNLRLITKLENVINSDRIENCLGYYFHKRIGKWRASIQAEGYQKHLGYFDTEEEARQHYLEQLSIYYPERYKKIKGQSNEN